MNNQERAKKYFDDRDYKMEVIHDDGVHRHLSFKHHNIYDGSFQITTWPANLCMTGDMGCFVFSRFSRVPDMLNFFVGDGINPGYWSEKCLAGSSHSGHLRDFDFNIFKEKISAALSEYLEEEAFDEDTVEKATEALEQLEDVEPDEHGAVAYLRELDGELIELCDMPDFRTWNFHYLFACYAINFACNTYLEATQKI